jgi:hypothetical protein
MEPRMTARPAREFDIRLLTPEEDIRLDIDDYAFGATPHAPEPEEERRTWLPYLAKTRLPHAFDDAGTAVARLGIYPQTMNVRGKLLASGGIGGVATLPNGRRSGMVRALMEYSYTLMREDGQPVSGLYPFRESFYQRLGYAGWVRPMWAKVDPAGLNPLLKTGRGGTVRWGRIADLWDDWTRFLGDAQADIHGFTVSDSPRGDLPKMRNTRWVALVEEDGRITGGMTYRITGFTGSMVVPVFLPLTVNARYALLEWIARHVDQVKETRIQLRPGSWPELWMHDVEADACSRDEEAWAAPMGRVVSIEGLSGIGAGDGEVTLEIVDEQCPWNSGPWTFRGSGGELEVARTGSPAATLPIQALSSLVFNGTGPGSEPETFRYRGWGAVDPETADALRALFPPVLPYMYDQF